MADASFVPWGQIANRTGRHLLSEQVGVPDHPRERAKIPLTLLLRDVRNGGRTIREHREIRSLAPVEREEPGKVCEGTHALVRRVTDEVVRASEARCHAGSSPRLELPTHIVRKSCLVTTRREGGPVDDDHAVALG